MSLRDLLKRSDTNADGRLDAVDLRNVIRTILPSCSEAQMVYIRAALNPAGVLQLPYEDFITAYNKQVGFWNSYGSGLLTLREEEVGREGDG